MNISSSNFDAWNKRDILQSLAIHIDLSDQTLVFSN